MVAMVATLSTDSKKLWFSLKQGWVSIVGLTMATRVEDLDALFLSDARNLKVKIVVEFPQVGLQSL